MAFKVIQWGAGRNGSALIRAVVRHPDLDLVGCRVWSPSKNGCDAGVLAGLPPIGVIATTDRHALIALDADVVLVCPSMRPDFTETDDDIVALLRSGKNVISVSGAHSMPAAIAGGYGDRFDSACAAGNSTFAAAGINPGFIAERLAPTVTGLCADVVAVHVEETYDTSVSNPGVFFETMGFGRALNEWTNDSPVARMFDHMFAQSLHSMAHSFGFVLTDVRRSAFVAPAHRDITVKAGTVKQGTVAVIVQTWEGVPLDPEQISLRKTTRWICADDIPGYPVKSGWQVQIEGKPSIVVEVRLEPEKNNPYLAEAMIGSAISVIPEVMKAGPGFLLPSIFAPFRRRFGTA